MSGSWEKMGDNLEVAKNKLYEVIELLAFNKVELNEDIVQKVYGVINILDTSYAEDYEDPFDEEREDD